MKRYRLKKDLPMFKAGTVFRLTNKGHLAIGDRIIYHKKDLKKHPGILKEWFTEIPEQICWEDNAIKSNLANLLIAPVDYVEDEVKYFTWDEACAIEKKLDNGWRLPTRSEWALICEEFGQRNGGLDVEPLMNKLSLVKNGVQFPDGEISDAGNEGAYWSSIAYPRTSNAYDLRFNTGANVFPSSSWDRYIGLSVRLVKDLEKRNG